MAKVKLLHSRELIALALATPEQVKKSRKDPRGPWIKQDRGYYTTRPLWRLWLKQEALIQKAKENPGRAAVGGLVEHLADTCVRRALSLPLRYVPPIPKKPPVCRDDRFLRMKRREQEAKSRRSAEDNQNVKQLSHGQYLPPVQ